MSYNPRDHYFLKAKKDGYLARSAYKLEEIQKKYKVIKPGHSVLDLGCAPGAWSQVVLETIGANGNLRGIDLKPVSLSAKNAQFMERDIFTLKEEEFLEAPYNCVLSDMAPNTTGIMIRDQTLSEELCMKVLTLSDALLRPSGNLVMKLFMGGGSKAIENEAKARFENLRMLKPQSTRKESKEIFLIGLKKKTRP